MKYTNHFRTRAKADSVTPQNQAVPGKKQIKNWAGGYTFKIDDWKRVERFLILGCESGGYYASEKKMTIENAQAVLACANQDGKSLVNMIVEISDKGRAIKNTPALFALAICASVEDLETKTYALNNLHKVARIGTHLFQFIEYTEAFRGWGRGLKRAVQNWYLDMPVSKLAYQVVKYQQRDGWAHSDLLRLSHPKTDSLAGDALFEWIMKKGESEKYKKLVDNPLFEKNLAILADFEAVKKAVNKTDVIEIIKRGRLPWEAIPTNWLAEAEVWQALLPVVPLTALIRNLGRLTANGLLKPLSAETKLIVNKLADKEYLKKSRIHPISILLAMKIYEQGHGEKGSLIWQPVTQIVNALDKAFYDAFEFVEPSGKNFLIGVDVSGSMTSKIAGMPLTSCEVSAAVALTLAKTEPNNYVFGFCERFVDLGIHQSMSLQEATDRAYQHNFGSTDCAQPMLHAIQHKLDVDTFIVITDNETWVGKIHPFEALKQYRQKMNKPQAKLIVLATESSNISIADPSDPYMLDIPGFSSDVPSVISEFSKM